MKKRLTAHIRLIIGILFLGIFLGRFSFACFDYKIKAKFAVNAENEEDNSQSNTDQKTEYKKSTSEYEHFVAGTDTYLVKHPYLPEPYTPPAASTQPWHLSVPTPPPNFTA